MSDYEIEENDRGTLNRERLQAHVMKSTSGITRIRIDNLAEPLKKLPSKKEARELLQPAILNSAVLGIFVSENQALIDNLEKLKAVSEVAGPLDLCFQVNQILHEP